MTDRHLSKNEQECLAFIAAFNKAYNRGVRQRNVAVALNFRTIPPARKVVERLCDIGLVTRLPGQGPARYILANAPQTCTERHVRALKRFHEWPAATAAIDALRKRGASIRRLSNGKHLVDGIVKSGAEIRRMAAALEIKEYTT